MQFILESQIHTECICSWLWYAKVIHTELAWVKVSRDLRIPTWILGKKEEVITLEIYSEAFHLHLFKRLSWEVIRKGKGTESDERTVLEEHV